MERVAWLAVVAVALVFGGGGLVLSQTPKPDLNMMSLTSPEDAVLTRRIAMTTIGKNNDFLHDTFDGHFDYSQREVSVRLDAISTAMLAFPHLFRAAPEVWSAELEAADPATASLALPRVWLNWEDFNARSMAASRTAFEASRAPDRNTAKRLTDNLEMQCESCHALYRREMVTVDIDQLFGPANP